MMKIYVHFIKEEEDLETDVRYDVKNKAKNEVKYNVKSEVESNNEAEKVCKNCKISCVHLHANSNLARLTWG